MGSKIGANIKVLLVDSTGIISTQSFSVGSALSTSLDVAGQLKFSPDGSKFGLVAFSGLVELYEFDRCTGTVSQAVTIFDRSSAQTFYGCSFSHSGRFFYFSDTSRLFQLDLKSFPDSHSTSLIYVDSLATTSFAQHLRGPDNRIYISITVNNRRQQTTLRDSLRRHLHVISAPDSAGQSCDFRPFSLSLNRRFSYMGLPNMPNYKLGASSLYLADAGEDISVCFGDSVQLGGISDSTLSYTWLTDDHLSSSTIANPWAFPDETTTFVLSIEDSSSSFSCSFRLDTVTVRVLPAPEIPELVILEDSILAVSGAMESSISYQWFVDEMPLNMQTDSFVIPSSSGWYELAVTNHLGCTVMSDAIYWSSVGIAEVNEPREVQVVYSIESRTLGVTGIVRSSIFRLFDVWGREVLEFPIKSEGYSGKISLPNGLYYYSLTSDFGVQQAQAGELFVFEVR